MDAHTNLDHELLRLAAGSAQAFMPHATPLERKLAQAVMRLPDMLGPFGQGRLYAQGYLQGLRDAVPNDGVDFNPLLRKLVLHLHGMLLGGYSAPGATVLPHIVALREASRKKTVDSMAPVA